MALANYEILQRKEFYKTNFESVLDNLIGEKMSSVNVTGLTIPTGKNMKSYQETHQKRVIRDYIVPLIYLIYSMVYTKFYNNQCVKQIQFESKLNYNMYSYVFSHKNPIIKTVNIFMYKYFEKSEDTGNNSTGINKYMIAELKDGTFKSELMNFLTENNKLLSPNTTSADKIKIILKGLKEGKTQIQSIYGILNNINLSLTTSGRSNTAYKDLIAKFSNKNYKLDTFLDSISYANIGYNKDLFAIYEIEYSNAITSYKNLLEKNIKTVNENILYIDFSNETDEEKYGIITDNISLNNINSYINYYENLLKKELKENNILQVIGDGNITLEGLINDEKDLIMSFLKDKNNNSNNNKNKDLLTDIYNTKKDLYNNLYDIINNILAYTKYKKLEEAKKEGEKYIVTATDIKNIIEKSNDVFKEILKDSSTTPSIKVSTMKQHGIVESEKSNSSKGAIYSCTRYIAESVTDNDSANDRDKFKAKEEAYQALLWVCSNFLAYNKMLDELTTTDSNSLSMVVMAVGSTAKVYNKLKTVSPTPTPTLSVTGVSLNNYKGSLKYYPYADTTSSGSGSLLFTYTNIDTDLKTVNFISNIRTTSTSSLPANYINILDKYKTKNIDQLTFTQKVITETKIVRNSSVASVLASYIAFNAISSDTSSSGYTGDVKVIVDKINQEVIDASLYPEKMTVASAAILTLVNKPDSTKDDILNASKNVILDFISKNEDVFRNFNTIVKDYNKQGNLNDKIKNIYNLKDDEIEPRLKMQLYMYKSILSNEIIEFNYLNSIKKSILNSNKIYENLDIHFKIIKQYFNDYEKTYKKYRKEGDKGFDLFIKKLADKKKSFTGFIEDYKNDIIVIDEKILPLTTSITSKDTNKTTKIGEKKLLDDKKTRYTKLIKNIDTIDGHTYRSFDSGRRTLFGYIKQPDNLDLYQKLNSKLTKTYTGTIKNEIDDIKRIAKQNITDNIGNLAKPTSIDGKLSAKNTEIKSINNSIKNLSTKQKGYNDKKSIIQINVNNYTSFSTEIDTITSMIETKKTKQSSNKDNIDTLFTNEFKQIIKISKDLDDKKNAIEYDSSKNKLYHSYQADKVELNKYIDSILTIDINTYKNFNTYNKLPSPANKIQYKKNHDLNTTLNNSNVKRYLIEGKIDELTEDLTSYFNTDYNTEDSSNFLKTIIKIQDTNKKNITKPFFDQYKIYHDKLIKQIQDLLTQIDNGELILNNDLINYIGIQNFITQLQKKKQKRDKITIHAQEDDNHPKGKYTVVLPYTDIMYLYFINLLIIIDYLKYFYK